MTGQPMTGQPMTGQPGQQFDPGADVVDFLAPSAFVDATTCDREPIHLSGAIQPHGLLLVVDEADLVVRQLSGNTLVHLGVEPGSLLGRPLAIALGSEPVERLRAALSSQRTATADPLTCHLPTGASYELTWHRLDTRVVVELEPTDVAGAVSMSVLFADVNHAMRVLQEADSVQQLCDRAATEIRRITGYDRVMVYRFHPDEHGEVVAEDREPAMEPFLGLHYPASDIPRQAMKLYLLNHLRVIADVDYTPVPLLAEALDSQGPLDLSRAGLRSVSPFHLTYLHNMGVGGTLTISLMSGTKLWGMLACHHRGPRRIDAQMRAACRMLGQVFSLQVGVQEGRERASYRARLAEVQAEVVARMTGADSLAVALVQGEPSALLLAGAEGLVARIDGQVVTTGVVPPPQAVEALLTRLCAQELPAALVCDELGALYAELKPFAEQASGVLALPLSAAYEDFALWFRGELIHQVSWAGDPDEQAKHAVSATTGLNPRASFASWVQEVRGHSRPWLDAEIDTGQAFAAAIPELLLARTRDRFAQLALQDPLTGLPNRDLLLDRGAAALSRQRQRGGIVALLVIDLDRFQIINDGHGRAAGDQILRQAGQRLSALSRSTDTVVRLGGDRFGVLCEGIAAGEAEQLADQIVQSFRAAFACDGEQIYATVSIGVSVAQEAATPVELLRDADTAMHRAKRGGRDSSALFTHEMRAVKMRRSDIEGSLRAALHGQHLRLDYQPICTVRGALTGFEALVRWPLAGRGMVPPLDFLPVAEASGLLAELTDLVLGKAIAQLAVWRRQHPGRDLTLAVNLTASQLLDADLEGGLTSRLLRYQVPARALCLEIPEPALLVDDLLVQERMQRLHATGVRLAVDNFGTGSSSLSHLAKLPIQEIKIDRSFIAGLPSRQGDVTVVASLVGLAQRLGLTAVAVGVESSDQLAAVGRLGCERVQGYLLGRPMAAGDIDRLLEAAVPQQMDPVLDSRRT